MRGNSKETKVLDSLNEDLRRNKRLLREI